MLAIEIACEFDSVRQNRRQELRAERMPIRFQFKTINDGTRINTILIGLRFSDR
jgi:hypothetical protein